MGLFTSLSQGSLLGSGASRGGSSAAPAERAGPRGRPETAQELEELIAAARAAFKDPDTVERHLSVGGEEGLTDAQLKRWLAARGWDPARAAADLAAHAAWRAEFVPRGRVMEDEVAAEIGQQKVFIQGTDRHGRPVAILKGGNHVPSADQLGVQKFYCYASDACLAIADPVRNPEGRVVFIIDVGDFGWKNFDLHGAKTLFGMMSAHYVERLSTVYFHNAGALLMQLYKLVSPFIDPRTREKVVFLPNDPAEAAAILAKDVDVQMLPPNLGGSSAPRPVERVWADILAARAEASSTAASSDDLASALSEDSASASDEPAPAGGCSACGSARAGASGAEYACCCNLEAPPTGLREVEPVAA